jgi:hypothetical protein
MGQADRRRSHQAFRIGINVVCGFGQFPNLTAEVNIHAKSYRPREANRSDMRNSRSDTKLVQLPVARIHDAMTAIFERYRL